MDFEIYMFPKILETNISSILYRKLAYRQEGLGSLELVCFVGSRNHNGCRNRSREVPRCPGSDEV